MKSKPITADTLVYLIENEEGDLSYRLTPPDYPREMCHKTMTLRAFAIGEHEKRYYQQLLRDITR